MTVQQWKELAAKHKEDKKSKNYKQNNSSYSEYQIFLSRAQESNDYFLSTLIHQQKECVLKTILDSGSDENVITSSVLSILGISLPAGTTNPSVELADGRIEQSSGVVTIEVLRLANRLILRDIRCVVLGNSEAMMLIGRPLMKSLGIDPQRDLNLLLGNSTITIDDPEMKDDEIISVVTPVNEALQDLKVRTKLALQNDMQDTKLIDEFVSAIEKHESIFRVGLDNSPPILFDPYRPTLKPGKGPVRAIPRKYNPRQGAFLRETVEKLCE